MEFDSFVALRQNLELVHACAEALRRNLELSERYWSLTPCMEFDPFFGSDLRRIAPSTSLRNLIVDDINANHMHELAEFRVRVIASEHAVPKTPAGGIHECNEICRPFARWHVFTMALSEIRVDFLRRF